MNIRYPIYEGVYRILTLYVLFKDKSPVKFTQDKQGAVLKLKEALTNIDHVVRIDF